MAKSYQAMEWKFLNYGYAPLNGDPEMLELEEQDLEHRYSIQLYYHVAGAVDLTDLEVLEVGSGRGGGAEFIKRYLKPKNMVGVDFAKDAVEISNRNFGGEGLSFQVGNAMDLPFEDDRFDAVVNVESSHCYPSVEAFFGQVNRVLRSGGHFLMADLRPKEEVDTLREQLVDAGLTIISEKEITPNVVESLRLDNERKTNLIQNNIKKSTAKVFLKFAGTEGSKVNENFKNGDVKYMSFVLQKP